jgi:hypothetical protein
MMPGTTPGPRTRRGRSLLYEGFAASLGVNESQFNRMWMMWRSGHTHPLVPVREDALRRLAELTDMRGVATAHGAWRAVKEAAERAAQAAPSPERTKLHAVTAQLRGSFGGLGDPHQFGVSLSPFERRAAAIELGRYKDTLATLITHLRKDPTP